LANAGYGTYLCANNPTSCACNTKPYRHTGTGALRRPPLPPPARRQPPPRRRAQQPARQSASGARATSPPSPLRPPPVRASRNNWHSPQKLQGAGARLFTSWGRRGSRGRTEGRSGSRGAHAAAGVKRKAPAPPVPSPRSRACGVVVLGLVYRSAFKTIPAAQGQGGAAPKPIARENGV
jgi:hypothetical protein